MSSLRVAAIALAVPVIGLVVGCAGTRPESPTPARASPAAVRGIVFVAEGAGNIGVTSRMLRQVVGDEGYPLRVVKVEWSHGTGRVLADQTDYDHARAEGRRLAGRVEECRRENPGAAVSLVGYCAGSAVVLAAAESLPPEGVETIVLLAPSVSCRYDLRRALRGTRRGIDVFHSECDVVFLGLGAALVGPADRRWGGAAGRTGFRAEPVSAEDRVLFAKLRQHPWTPRQMKAWHLGGHGGTQKAAFVRAYVLPLLAGGVGPGRRPAE